MITHFLSADWAKDSKKRSVYHADIRKRTIQQCTPPSARWWSLGGLLETAHNLEGPVLIGIDLVLGIPRGCWDLTDHDKSFISWLRSREPDFFEEANSPMSWSMNRPWFRVPEGDGGRSSFTGLVKGEMLRNIDRDTGANPVFVISGIPGVVGGATREFWREIYARPSGYAVWPFDGSLKALTRKHDVVLAETYPALAYAAAVSPNLPTRRIRLAKTKRECRERVVDFMSKAQWVKDYGVDLGDLKPLYKCDDNFDAHLTAAAALRCILNRQSLTNENWIDNVAEGSMLLAGAVRPDQVNPRPFDDTL